MKHFNCPECGRPDIGDLGEIKDFYLELFVAMVSNSEEIFHIPIKTITNGRHM